MPTDYIVTNTTTGNMTDNTVPTGTARETTITWDRTAASTTSGTTATRTLTVAAVATNTVAFVDTPALGALVTGLSGSQSYTLRLYVASGTVTNLTALSFHIARFNTSGVLQGSISAQSTTSGAVATATQYTMSLSADLGAFTTTDRLRVYIRCANSSTMTAQTPAFNTNTAVGATASYLTVPWPAPILEPEIMRAGFLPTTYY